MIYLLAFIIIIFLILFLFDYFEKLNLKKEANQFWDNHKKIYQEKKISKDTLHNKYVASFYNRFMLYFLMGLNSLLILTPLISFIGAKIIFDYMTKTDAKIKYNLSKFFATEEGNKYMLFKNDPNGNFFLADHLVKGGNLYLSLLIMLLAAIIAVAPFIYLYHKRRPEKFESWERGIFYKKD